jgi:hypothetical protein
VTATERAKRIVEITVREALNKQAKAPINALSYAELEDAIKRLVAELPPPGKLKIVNFKVEGTKATFDIVLAED